MVVEDEVVIAMRLQQRLTELGYDVTGVAYSGDEAVEKAKSLSPDLILMDIMIPGKLDGIEAAKTLKTKLGIPVIFLTAYSEEKIIQRAKKAEPYGYILKPFQDRELKAAIDVALYKKKMEKALKESEAKFRDLAENASDGILVAVRNGVHVYANKRAAEMTGYSVSKLLNTTIKDLAHPNDFEKIKKKYYAIITGKPFQRQYETRIIGKDGKEIPIEVSSARSIWEGQPAEIIVIRDISQRIKAEKALKKARDELEQRVKERTRELEIKTKSLVEINTAMKVFLEKREENKVDLEDTVLTNIKELVEPYVQKLKKTRLNDQQKALLKIIESNLNEIVSPFSRNMLIKYLKLTPQEIRIANLIRHGDSTKRIAETLNISPRTVETHRKNIRSKIGLEGKKANLRSLLLSFD